MMSGRDDANTWGAIIMIIAAVTDKLDGDVARHFHQETEWGKILDPIADKIGVGTTLVILLLLDRIPFWFVASVLSRDLLILLAGLWLKQSKGVVLPSNMTGKWAVGIIALTLFLALVAVPTVWVDGGIIISIGLLIASLILYGSRFMNVLRSGTNGNS
jgi:CDP-diacylglycerol--glycerol-3-phosphate 3-phosphatidyltransferase